MAKSKAARLTKPVPHVLIEVPPRQDPKISEKLSFGRINRLVGTTPKE